MRYGSVCSGVEAATLAWHHLGWQPVFFAEVEPFPCAVLQQRFNATKPLRPLDPAEAVDDADRAMRESWLKQINRLPNTGTIPNLGDFTKIKRDDYDGEIDLLVGGTPCQDLSVAGKRAGFDGHRSSLALDFVRLAYELGAKWFVWENVPGVFSSNGGGDFAALLSLFCGREIGIPKQGFARAGFVCPDRADRFGLAWRVLDAQYTRTPIFPFAVPQRRRRVFIVGCLGHWERAAEVLLDPQSVSWNPPKRFRARERVAGGVERCTGETIVFHGSQDPIFNDATANPINLNQGQENCILDTGGGQDGFCEPVACSLEATYYKGCAWVWNERTIVSDVLSLATGQAHQSQNLGVNVSQSLVRVNGGYSYIAYENYGNDSRVTESGDVSPVLTSRIGTGGGNTPLVQRTEENEMKAVDLYNGTLDDSPTCRTASATDCTHVPSVLLTTNNKESENGQIEKTRPSEILRVLRSTLGEKTFSEWLGRHGSVSEEEILRQNVHGKSVRCEAELFNEQQCLPSPCEKDCPAREMRDLWCGKRNGCSPHRQRLSEQQSIEPHANLSELSLQDSSEEKTVCDMWQTTKGAWLLREALDEIQKIRKSASVQAESVRYDSHPTVRRLLCIEAERLMGFPDNHTKIEWNGKSAEDCPDAPRYKACGNSMCVNCMEWIGRRIEEIERKYNDNH